MARQRTAAIVYDFDGTLSPGNMQEHSFLPEFHRDAQAFWEEVGKAAAEHDADEILIYMEKMLACAREKELAITRDLLAKHGKELPLFPGVTDWFQRMNERATSLELDLQHFIISSGLEEMIAGCDIAPEFAHVFASHFLYEDGVARWPAVAINYTTKTQYLFRINKGIRNSHDRKAVNQWMRMDERPVPFDRMIFLGDGETDIPCMKMVRYQGGQSIAVYDPEGDPSRIHRLLAEDRVNFVAPANYCEDSPLDITVHGLLARIAEGLRP